MTRTRWIVATALMSSAVLLGACEGASGRLGDVCVLEEESDSPIQAGVEVNNSTCNTDACIAIGTDPYCTRACRAEDDCPEGWLCLPTDPIAEGAYCVRILQHTEAEPSAPRPGSALYGAQEATEVARRLWSPDAYVILMDGQDVPKEGLLGAKGEWTYEFISPSRPNKGIRLEVTAAGVEEDIFEYEVNLDEFFTSGPVDLIGQGAWRFDSQDLFELARQYGADEFLAQHPDAEAGFSISPAIIMGQPTAMWTFSLQDFDAGFYVKSWSFDAATGDKIL